jgi:HlyD family secretion protein
MSNRWWLAIAVCAALAGGVVWYVFLREGARRDRGSPSRTHVQLKVIKPKIGGMERRTTQPGTIHAYQYEDVYAKVSGFLVNQHVDIGSEVTDGQVLAEIDAPELEKEEQLAAANVEEAKSRIEQMKAHKEVALAEFDATKALVLQRKAEKIRAVANLEFRRKRFKRFEELSTAEVNVIDKNFVDEQFEQLEAARSWRDAADAAINTATADVAAKKAKIAQADADLAVAQANKKVAEASLGKAQLFVGFTKITSHYNGKVTHRSFHKGAYIRNPDKGGTTPLYTIKRTDKMRLIVQVPDADVPFADPTDPVDLRIPTLPQVTFKDLKISRIGYTQDERTRTMRVEIDLGNKEGYLRDGMYGEVTIHLQKGARDAFTVPSPCVHGTKERGDLRVYVVREGLTRTIPVVVGQDNGRDADIAMVPRARDWLRAGDLVVMDHVGVFENGVPADTAEVDYPTDS